MQSVVQLCSVCRHGTSKRADRVQRTVLATQIIREALCGELNVGPLIGLVERQLRKQVAKLGCRFEGRASAHVSQLDQEDLPRQGGRRGASEGADGGGGERPE